MVPHNRFLTGGNLYYYTLCSFELTALPRCGGEKLIFFSDLTNVSVRVFTHKDIYKLICNILISISYRKLLLSKI